MKMRFLFAAAGATALAAGLAAQTPAPAAPNYRVQFAVDQNYAGTASFAVDDKGNVTGNMTIDDPIDVHATLIGTVKDGLWTFDKMTFTIPNENCTGTSSGSGNVSPDRKLITGHIHAEGCSDQPLEGTFTFTKIEK